MRKSPPEPNTLAYFMHACGLDTFHFASEVSKFSGIAITQKLISDLINPDLNSKIAAPKALAILQFLSAGPAYKGK